VLDFVIAGPPLSLAIAAHRPGRLMTPAGFVRLTSDDWRAGAPVTAHQHIRAPIFE